MSDEDKKCWINSGVCGCPLVRTHSYFNLSSQCVGVSFARAWHEDAYKSDCSQNYLCQPHSFTSLWQSQEARNIILFFTSLVWKCPASLCQMYPLWPKKWLPCRRWEGNSWVIAVRVFTMPRKGESEQALRAIQVIPSAKSKPEALEGCS